MGINFDYFPLNFPPVPVFPPSLLLFFLLKEKIYLTPLSLPLPHTQYYGKELNINFRSEKKTTGLILFVCWIHGKKVTYFQVSILLSH